MGQIQAMEAGPRRLVPVHAMGATGGHCDDPGGYRPRLLGKETGPEEGVANGREAVRAPVRLEGVIYRNDRAKAELTSN